MTKPFHPVPIPDNSTVRLWRVWKSEIGVGEGGSWVTTPVTVEGGPEEEFRKCSR